MRGASGSSGSFSLKHTAIGVKTHPSEKSRPQAVVFTEVQERGLGRVDLPLAVLAEALVGDAAPLLLAAASTAMRVSHSTRVRTKSKTR